MKNVIGGIVGLICLFLSILPVAWAQSSPLGQGQGSGYNLPTGPIVPIPVGPVTLRCPDNCQRGIQEVFRVENKSSYTLKLVIKARGVHCGLGGPAASATTAGYQAGVIKPGQTLNLDNQFTHGDFVFMFTPLPQGQPYTQNIYITSPYICFNKLTSAKVYTVTDANILSQNPGLSPQVVADSPAQQCPYMPASLTIINQSNQILAVSNRLENGQSAANQEKLGAVSPVSSQFLTKILYPGKNTLTFIPEGGGPAVTKVVDVINDCEKTALKNYKVTLNFDDFAPKKPQVSNCMEWPHNLEVNNQTPYPMKVSLSHFPHGCKAQATALLKTFEVGSGKEYLGIAPPNDTTTFHGKLDGGCNIVSMVPERQTLVINKQLEVTQRCNAFEPSTLYKVAVEANEVSALADGKNLWPHASLLINNTTEHQVYVILLRKKDARDFGVGSSGQTAYLPGYLFSAIQPYREVGYSEFMLGEALSDTTTFFKNMLPPGVNKLVFVYYSPDANHRVIKRSITVQNTPQMESFTFRETLNPSEFTTE